MKSWYQEEAFDEDVIVSSRVRLARNLKDYLFPSVIDSESVENLSKRIFQLVDSQFEENYNFYKIADIDSIDRDVMVEKHLISKDLSQNLDRGSFFLRDDEKVNIMVNEEDHLRIQVLNPGLNIEESWLLADRVDDILEEDLDYAFHEDFGYLTSCPTNVGTGLRASVMVHIPALGMGGYLNGFIEGLNKLGLTVRGIYGEGSQVLGDFYQISNQITLGESEKAIIDKLKSVVGQVISKEREVRDFLINNKSIELEDRVFRSLAIVSSARIVTGKEAMAHLSNIRLGMEAGLLNAYSYEEILDLLIRVQTGNLNKAYGRRLSKSEEDINRARLLREFFTREV